MAIATRATTNTAASTVATPASSLARFCRGQSFRGDEHTGQQPEPFADPGHDETALLPHLDPRPTRCDGTSRAGRREVISARGQPRRFTGRIDAAHLHRHRGDAPDAQQQNRYQRGEGQRGLDRAEPAIAGYALVLSARLMMLVKAPTIESPVTTL